MHLLFLLIVKGSNLIPVYIFSFYRITFVLGTGVSVLALLFLVLLIVELRKFFKVLWNVHQFFKLFDS